VPFGRGALPFALIAAAIALLLASTVAWASPPAGSPVAGLVAVQDG
jgi:hypothetical protein